MTTPTLLSRTAYVMAVSDALADLAAEDRAELIEELDDHVAALLTDRPDADLVTELGTPQAYAADLRAAAGLTRVQPSPTMRLRDLWTQAQSALPPWSRPILTAARPVWWALRGAVVALAIVAYFGARLTVVTVAWAVLVAVASVWLGQRTIHPRPDGVRRAALIIGNGVAVLLGIWLLTTSTGALGRGYDGGSYDPGPPCSDTTNLYAYDAAGQPLTDVRLYDQNGQPFDVSANSCGDSGFDPGAHPGQYPYPSAAPYGEDYPTAPPSSLAPLPGATLPPTTDAGAPSGTAAPSGAAPSAGTPAPSASAPSGRSATTPSAPASSGRGATSPSTAPRAR